MGCGSSKRQHYFQQAEGIDYGRPNSITQDLAFAVNSAQGPQQWNWGSIGGRQPSVNLTGAQLHSQPFSAARAPSVKSVPGTQLQWTESRSDLEDELQAGSGGVPSGGEKDDRSRLNDRLRGLGRFTIMEMQGDGNCQFRAISMNLYGNQEQHMVVRGKVVNHMLQHRDEFQPFLNEDWDRYIRDMKKSGTWGDELTLKACCDAYQILISVITSDEQHWFNRYEPQDKLKTYKGSKREMFLTYIAPVHYNTIRRQSSQGPIVDGGLPESITNTEPLQANGHNKQGPPKLETLTEVSNMSDKSASVRSGSGGTSIAVGPTPFAACAQQSQAPSLI